MLCLSDDVEEVTPPATPPPEPMLETDALLFGVPGGGRRGDPCSDEPTEPVRLVEEV